MGLGTTNNHLRALECSFSARGRPPRTSTTGPGASPRWTRNALKSLKIGARRLRDGCLEYAPSVFIGRIHSGNVWWAASLLCFDHVLPKNGVRWPNLGPILGLGAGPKWPAVGTHLRRDPARVPTLGSTQELTAGPGKGAFGSTKVGPTG